ncbi:semaphorin-7A [Thalassophryne amazonica]|uniref:semaphorin-7A n=1 Tax=Thalassophryne amazonica TaxID=390379 RepID=UPI0014712617|nr:semaphorin-7A [Thalassophryne amazonica]
MKRFVLVYLWLAAGDFQLTLSVGLRDTPTLGLKDQPRLLLRDIISGGFEHATDQNHSVLFHQEDSGELYIGGTNFVLKLNLDDCRVIEQINLKQTNNQECPEGSCENVVTVIEKFDNNLFVCGTDGYKPRCWKFHLSANNLSEEITENHEGTGISPFIYTQNSLSMTVEGDLYAAAPLEKDGSFLQFRRKAGSRTNVWMYDSWVSEPTFISASWVKQKDDPDNEKIYIFFQEKNSDHSPEAERWISRVARVCKVDEGGSKRFFQNMWTSFLKARLVCGFPEKSLYFNHLQDVYVMQADDWHDTRVYALFSSSWNATAVCIYSIRTIEGIFENSSFKGYSKDIPNPRPGTCVKNSRSLPLATVHMVKHHPEMSDWVYPEHHDAPFYVSSNTYSKIAVDRVQAADQQFYNILFLATDSGKIHKVLEAGSEPFIICETQLSTHSAVQSMKLDSKKKKLVVGLSEQISVVDLQRCEQYNRSCEECVLARDPYCVWTKSGCTPTVPGGIQSITDREIAVCHMPLEETDKVNKTKQHTLFHQSAPDKTEVHTIPLNTSFYFSCPIDSYHAMYTWEHQQHSSPCLQMQQACLHLVPAMADENYGCYKCVSKERGYTKVLKEYHLTKQIIPDADNTEKASCKINNASTVLLQRHWIPVWPAVAAVVGLLTL